MANYLKPQSPLQHKDGDYFYPLTTIDQIITNNDTRLNAELISVDLSGAIEGAPNKINADTLGGYTAEDFLNAKSSDVQLNYSIVGGTAEPANPTENMIWVETDVAITSHIISKNEPKNPIEGMVWIYIGNVSTVSFYKLKYNDIGIDEVYPISAKQYIDNTWIYKNTQSWQDGEWRDYRVYLFREGEGAISEFKTWIEGSSAQVTITNNAITKIYNDVAAPRSSVYTAKTHDITNYNNIYIEATSSSALQITGYNHNDGIGISTRVPNAGNSQMTDFAIACTRLTADGMRRIYSLDVSEIVGDYYIFSYGITNTVIHNIWMD